MCRAHAGVRHLLNSLLQEEDTVAVVDMEAGLEHLSRGTERGVDTLLVVMEPYFKSLETARRAAELAPEIGIERVLAVANKLRDDGDREAVRGYAASHGLKLIAEVPWDEAIHRSDLSGQAPIDAAPGAPAVEAVGGLATTLGF